MQSWVWGGCLLLAVTLVEATGVPVRLGNEVLASRHYDVLRGKRVGLITNQTGRDATGRSTIDKLRAAPGVKLVALFAPEHGLDGTVPAGQEFTNTTHRPTGLPLYSLYGPGPTRRPTPAMLKGLDVMVYELQDTGIRPYTYISTLGFAMDACAAAGIPFVVLDRPNPLGGQRVEGPVLDPRFRSFIGQWEIPLIYGMTCGELARMINGERWITNRCQLTVVPLEGWRRSMAWSDTRLPWVPTSPNVRTVDAALCLPTTGVLGEIGGVSIGFGTELPFQIFGASWLDGRQAAEHLNARGLKGVTFVPFSFQPNRGAFKDQKLHGVRVRVTHGATAPLLAINFHVLDAARKLANRNLYAEAAKSGKSFNMFDKVNGTDATRLALARGGSAPTIIAGWKTGEDAFRQRRQKYLLYP
ncbi:MAG: DUF1343 domain-containing protein [Verrucomicrobiales bacterium]|nr:DUF1343 domain-containing protein [Verrucomicrobiales bacterium]